MYTDVETGWTAESCASIIGKQALPPNLYAISEAPSYALVNLRISKQFGSVTIHTGLLNILDARQDAHTPTAIKLQNGNVNSTGVWGSLEGREVFLGVKLTL